jgi:hypothetical protein
MNKFFARLALISTAILIWVAFLGPLWLIIIMPGAADKYPPPSIFFWIIFISPIVGLFSRYFTTHKFPKFTKCIFKHDWTAVNTMYDGADDTLTIVPPFTSFPKIYQDKVCTRCGKIVDETRKAQLTKQKIRMNKEKARKLYTKYLEEKYNNGLYL